MILVDSCVWIDLLKGNTAPEVDFLLPLLDHPINEICISHIVYFEVLRGISLERHWRRIKELLERFLFFDYRQEGFDRLIDDYRNCQRKGFTLSRLGDWLIYKTVIDHKIELLTSDRDFHRLSQTAPFQLIWCR